MQTPVDARHWGGPGISSGQERKAARVFARACFAAGLDVVAITDHNFLSRDFIPILREAIEELRSRYGRRITVFPGFEFEAAGVGKGVHVLCLFDPCTDLHTVDSILTECGITFPRVDGAGVLEKSDKNLKEILRLVQKDRGGLVILPHLMSNNGLFDNDGISEWLQVEQFINPHLLACEVPKPVSQMSAGFQKLLRCGNDCNPMWKRIRPIATLMSSDNKTLRRRNATGRLADHSIGWRYTWIKMSAPSIEALRQAFLDHESRIELPEDVSCDTHPQSRIRHARICSLSIRNAAFLADQEIHFSEHKTCLIGGRGSGKSTVIEYLRIALGKDDGAELDDDTRARIERLRETLNNEAAEITVVWSSGDGIVDTIVWRGGEREVLDRELPDPDTYFARLPVRFYSQQQLTRMTESKHQADGIPQGQRLLELIDGFVTDQLTDLAAEERKTTLRLEIAFSKIREARILSMEHNRLRQELDDLVRQWNARTQIQPDSVRHQALKLEARFLDGVYGSPGVQFGDVAALAESVAASHTTFSVDDAPHAEIFSALDALVMQKKRDVASEIKCITDRFAAELSALLTGDPTWQAVISELEAADIEFATACTAKGLTPEDVGRLQEVGEARAKKEREVADTADQITQLNEAAGNPEIAMQELHAIWEAQYALRSSAAQRANELAVLNENGQRFIEVSVDYQRDLRSFRRCWDKLAPTDGRTRLGRNWREIGDSLFKRFCNIQEAKSPWQILHTDLGTTDGLTDADYGEWAAELQAYITENDDRWQALRRLRIQDIVDLKLFRGDGTCAGSMGEGKLSDGQRNTAALALLLAQDGGPLVIDQPEDELDSNFVFSELVPMLRKVKGKRQIIMSTHNANLPVNGDSELVYALEARNGRGELLACGGLDQPSVTQAVLNIMEGSEEAFRRRREKYRS
jgi:energy-coupling factor transporter ATP-binding protein EcfA2